MARPHLRSQKVRGADFSELRVDEAVANKSWAARKHGYKAVAKIFKNLEPRVKAYSIVNAADEIARYPSDGYEQSLNGHYTEERFYDAQEPNASEGLKRRITSPNTLNGSFYSNESNQRVDVTKSPKTKSLKPQGDENRQDRPKIVSEQRADAQQSRNSSATRKLRKKPLSPAAQQRLNSLRSTIEQRRSMWSDVQNPHLPSTTAKRNVEQEIAKKLESLESNVDACFEDIRQLSPLLYDEMNEPESQGCGSPTVLREFNKRLVRMEGLLKSMTFKENIHTGTGNVNKLPAVIRQGNGNWFIEGGY